MIKRTIQALTLASLLSCPALLQAKPQQNYSLLPPPKTEYSQIHFNLPSFQISLKDEDSLEEKCKRGEAPSYLCPNTYVAPQQETTPEEKRQEYLPPEEKTTPRYKDNNSDKIWGGVLTGLGVLCGLEAVLEYALLENKYGGAGQKKITTTGVIVLSIGSVSLVSGLYLLLK